ncbi:KaiC domain protein, AF_0351 family [Halopenitus malekzadehii]|uniref:KaiC domain protein, AF_0351 family n=1 Tax=Halopenitus malekzadehii TaxID=1267564 RepID=A0A1H6JD47_9EURY|nr:KaiC domain-containing protein [Halopenitus malekzadehii]SEH56957.1 KaiC domain protein, AF_0351 family [Halopenitus malekzadehii]
MTEDGGSGERDRLDEEGTPDDETVDDETEEEDWFERARRELSEANAAGGGSDTTGAGRAGGEEPTDGADPAGGTDPEPASASGSSSEADPGSSRPRDTSTVGDREDDGEFGDVDDSEFGDVDDSEFGDVDDGEGDVTDRDESGDVGFPTETEPGTPPDFDAGPGGGPGGGSDGEFGFASFGDDGDAGPPPTSGGTDFEDAELESDIERMDLGIEGLDKMILGGVPRRSLITTIGSAGTGKTTFGLQFIHKALTNGNRGVYITLEESREAILSTAEEKGYGFREYESDGMLSVVSIDPIEMANSLASIGNELGRLIREFDAERLVLDSVSLLEMMYDHPAKRRSEIFEFTRSLKQAGVTTMLISEASESNSYASRHGIVEYLTDAVFILQYVRPSDFRETRLAIEIQKIRNANHSRETKPYEITSEGISVYQQANIF